MKIPRHGQHKKTSFLQMQGKEVFFLWELQMDCTANTQLKH